jgi:uncharacterized membrane protein YtjA (UPF0391 family)
MPRWSLIFLIIAVAAGAFGFLGVGSMAVDVAQVLALAFIVLFVITLMMGRGSPSAVERDRTP